MRSFPTLSGARTRARQASSRRPRSYGPSCQRLEDRSLLSIGLSGSAAAAQVGTPVTWTASSSGHGTAPVYQFRVGPVGGVSHVVRDYSTSNSFTWTAYQEGGYHVDVTVKDGYGVSTGETASASYSASSRVSSGAVVSATDNPLVALYSVPASGSASVRVQYRLLGTSQGWQTTAAQAVTPGTSTNILVAGLLPRRMYAMRAVFADGTTAGLTRFRTGALPANLTFPRFKVQRSAGSAAARAQNVVFHVGITTSANTVNTLATNLLGQVVWYYDAAAHAFPNYAPRLVPGGTVLLLGGQVTPAGGVTNLREIDLAGNTLRETNINAVSAELAARGKPAITDFNHETLRLPNGDTAVLATTERTINLNGTPTLYKGDMVIVLDQNFQVAWTWDPFDWLDTNRLPALGEGAIDWTHANAISWSPNDGNLIVSMRNQDWVLKLAYNGGSGDGHIVWRLGKDGDFTAQSAMADPWFSHQHDATYVNGSTIVVFDNGNARRATNPRANSRGQEWVIDETTMQARLTANVGLGEYASAVGSAQKLANGTYVFGPGFSERTIITTTSGKPIHVLQMSMPGIQYRTYVFSTLYTS